MRNCFYKNLIVKKPDLFAEKINLFWLTYLSALLQPLDALPRFERTLRDDFSENFQNFCHVRCCARIVTILLRWLWAC